VTEIKDNTVYLEPKEGSWELHSSDCFTISLDDIAEKDEIIEGAMLEIIYSGSIEETYPAHFGDITGILIVKDSNGEIVTTEAITEAVELSTDDNEMSGLYGVPIDEE
jgi:hypothetical protein